MIEKGARVSGKDRAKLAADTAKQYRKGKSIRELADQMGRSYGFVHRLILEADEPMRNRGGARKKAAV